MNTQYVHTLLDDTILGVKVAFENDTELLDAIHTGALTNITGSYKTYTYLTKDKTIKVGDVVVVDARGKLTCVIVTEISETPEITENDTTKYKWIVGKVDYLQYVAVRQWEATCHKQIREGIRSKHKISAREALLAQYPALANNSPGAETTGETLGAD